MQRVAVACHRPLRGLGVAVGVCARPSLVLVVATACDSAPKAATPQHQDDLQGVLIEDGDRADLSIGTRSVDICIARLRRKIEIDPHRPRFIRTAHGDGYVLTTSTEPN
jgi:hypothetical protein